jgi:hypothetical protein
VPQKIGGKSRDREKSRLLLPDFLLNSRHSGVNKLRAGFLHDFGSSIAYHFGEPVIAINDGIVDYLSIGKNEAAI